MRPLAELLRRGQVGEVDVCCVCEQLTPDTSPDKAVPLTSFKGAVNRTLIEGRYTGASRGIYGRWPGAKEPSGSLGLVMWGQPPRKKRSRV